MKLFCWSEEEEAWIVEVRRNCLFFEVGRGNPRPTLMRLAMEHPISERRDFFLDIAWVEPRRISHGLKPTLLPVMSIRSPRENRTQVPHARTACGADEDGAIEEGFLTSRTGVFFCWVARRDGWDRSSRTLQDDNRRLILSCVE